MVMKFTKRKQVKKINLPGRIIQKVVGKDSFIKSNKMTMGFAYYSAESGVMQPHHHAEEIVYVITAKKAWVRYSLHKNQLGTKMILESGMTLCFDELEWHVFGYDLGGGMWILFSFMDK